MPLGFRIYRLRPTHMEFARSARTQAKLLGYLTRGLLAAAMLPGVASAELYCVSTSTQLVNAVAAANASAGASEIRVVAGRYSITPPGGGYALTIDGEGDLLLTGGWSGATCQTRGSLNPELTLLGTGGVGKLMEVVFPFERAATIEISGVGFRSALSNDTEPACLRILSERTFDTRNTLILDRNSFRLCNNTANAVGPSTLKVDARNLNAYIRNNVVADNGGSDDVVRLLARSSTTMFVSNNTIAFNPRAVGGLPRTALSIAGTDVSSFFWIVNNVGSNNGNSGSGLSDFAESTGVTAGIVSHNLFRTIAVSPSLTFINNLQSDPLLTSSVDLRVTAASPLRNSGVTPNGSALDRDSLGMQRVQGGRIDRGAFEFEELFNNGFE